MLKLVHRFVREDQGQDLVEYAMLLALIAIVVAVGVTAFGGALNGFYAGLFNAIPLGS
jgi:pilus assembly protein Flp/PilA